MTKGGHDSSYNQDQVCKGLESSLQLGGGDKLDELDSLRLFDQVDQEEIEEQEELDRQLLDVGPTFPLPDVPRSVPVKPRAVVG